MAKNINPTKVITGKDTRWSYCNVWDAKSINGGTPKFSVSLIIPKSDEATVRKIKAAIDAAYHDGESKLRGNGKTVPPLVAIKNPLRDGDTERPDDPAYANSYFVNANSATARLTPAQPPHRAAAFCCAPKGGSNPWAVPAGDRGPLSCEFSQNSGVGVLIPKQKKTAPNVVIN